MLNNGARFNGVGIGNFSFWGLLGNEISTLQGVTGNHLILQYNMII